MSLIKQSTCPITIGHCQDFDALFELAQGLDKPLDQGVIFNNKQFEHGGGCNQGYYWRALYH